MFRRNSQSIGDVIKQFINESNLENKIFEQKIIRLWPEIMGPQIAEMTTNIYVKNKVLYISVSSSVLRNELLMCRSTLVKSINKSIGTELLSNVIIR